VRDGGDDDTVPTYGLSKLQNGASKPGDELQGDYTRRRLLQMDARFCERLKRAIVRGEEHDSHNMDRPPPQAARPASAVDHPPAAERNP